jgi:hypothetical protein
VAGTAGPAVTGPAETGPWRRGAGGAAGGGVLFEVHPGGDAWRRGGRTAGSRASGWGRPCERRGGRGPARRAAAPAGVVDIRPGAPAGLPPDPALAIVLARRERARCGGGDHRGERRRTGSRGRRGAGRGRGGTGGALGQFCETGPGLQPGLLATRLSPVLAGFRWSCCLTADGRDLAPRLAARLGTAVGRARRASLTAGGPGGPGVAAELSSDDRTCCRCRCGTGCGHAGAGDRIIGPPPGPAVVAPLSLPGFTSGRAPTK